MAKQGSVFLKFRQFDAYAKTLDDFRVKTTTGATVTIISILLIGYLVISEILTYTTPTWRPSLIVDKGRKEKLTINFNVTFPHMPCHMLSLDVMDDSGEHLSGLTHNVYKVRLDAMGQIIDTEKEYQLGDKTHVLQQALQAKDECGSCYGAVSVREDGCCPTCGDVREAYVKMGWGLGDTDKIEQCVRENWKELFEHHSNEGCNLNGRLSVNKIRGNFHIAPGQAFTNDHMHLHDIQSFLAGAPDGHSFDLSHQIHQLKFGPIETGDIPESLLTITNPLGGTTKITDQVQTSYQYFLKIVSTELIPLRGNSIYTNQYSFTSEERVLAPYSGDLPGVFFMMDISPMQIIYRENQPSLISLITSLVGIIGGIFTVAGLVDSVVYRAERSFKRKVELGKAL
ncbi:endoplasmic reticulum vesicle transporter-domain-containing protein [Halteromyces radiatus]|uniref:endoplasmic reticulum vesicle transporter-domain-containing protein n=1 Tax=Halteromyces radiatus TaxID=101107 RepID=UPI00221E9E0E|nr:endoplasmic reticulum vesicle transporter-domain-containing protein [Halteromyces radiatus]KAI8098694.1 endoplasmic reticulum vesicle transporter-domain-containing protein [Halteromyces radiatus]